MTYRNAIDIAAAAAFDFDHTDETRAARKYLQTEIDRGSWAPAHVRNMRAALAILDALR